MKEDFFKNAIYKYQKELGLTNYEIHVFPIDVAEYRATHAVSTQGRIASVYYRISWFEKASIEEIDKVAYHEVWEINLDELSKAAKNAMPVQDVNRVVHDIIRRAENMYYDRYHSLPKPPIERLREILMKYGQNVINTAQTQGSWSLTKVADKTIEDLQLKDK